MVVVDTHCHASPYWYAPVESLWDEMSRAGVDKATLVQIGGIYDNSYLVECMRSFPGRFSVVGMVDTTQPDAPDRLEEWAEQGVESVRLGSAVRSPGDDPQGLSILWDSPRLSREGGNPGTPARKRVTR